LGAPGIFDCSGRFGESGHNCDGNSCGIRQFEPSLDCPPVCLFSC
jgi:hypothetical protein